MRSSIAKVCVSLLVSLTLVMSAVPTDAAQKKTTLGKAPVVLMIETDLSTSELVIIGFNLHDGVVAPLVTLGGDTLTVTGFDPLDDQIVTVELPADFESGDELLVLETSDGFVEYELTIDTQSDLACVACVSESELDFDSATQTELDSHKATADAHHSKTIDAGELTQGMLSNDRLGPSVSMLGPSISLDELDFDVAEQAELNTHSASPGAHHSKTVSASELTTGVLDNARLDPSVSLLGQSISEAELEFGAVSELDLETHRADSSAHHEAFTQGNTTSVGENALLSITSGLNNTAIGGSALRNVTLGWVNTAVGTVALADNISGNGNTAVGANAIRKNTTGDSNTAIGTGALYENLTGAENFAAGYSALRNNTAGSGNTAVGYEAGMFVTGNDNIHINNPGDAADTATIKIGEQGVQTSTFIAGIDGNDIVGKPVVVDLDGQLGTGTLSEASLSFDPTTQAELDAHENDVEAHHTKTINAAELTLGTLDNTRLDPAVSLLGQQISESELTFDPATQGELAAHAGNAAAHHSKTVSASELTSGVLDNARLDLSVSRLGQEISQSELAFDAVQQTELDAHAADPSAHHAAFTEADNTGIGQNALTSNTTGVFNTAMGSGALRDNTAGGSNTATGNRALEKNTTGGGNTAIGASALGVNTTGSGNTATGSGALGNNTTGLDNTATGWSALAVNTLGATTRQQDLTRC